MNIQCDNFRSFNNNARNCMKWEHRNGELDTQRMQIKLKNSCIYILPIGPGPWPLNVTRSHQQSQQSSILTDLIRVCPGLLWFRQDFANVFGIRKLELWTTRWWKDFVSFGTVHECDGRMDERTDSKELEIISALILSPIRRDAVNPYALEWWLWFEIGIASRCAIGLTVQPSNFMPACRSTKRNPTNDFCAIPLRSRIRDIRDRDLVYATNRTVDWLTDPSIDWSTDRVRLTDLVIASANEFPVLFVPHWQ